MASANSKKTPAVQSTRQQLDELDALLQKMLALPVAPSEAETDEPAVPATVVHATPGENPLLPRRVSLRPVSQTAEPEQADVPQSPFGPRLVQPDQAVSQQEIPAPDEEGSSEWVPLRGSWQPSAQTWGPLAEIFKQQQQSQDSEAYPDEEPGVIRETVRIPIPTRSAEAAPTPHLPSPEESAASSVEAMARLELARRAATNPHPAPPPLPLSTQLLPDPTPAAPPVRGGNLALFPLVALNAVYDVATYPLGPVGRWMRDGGRGGLALLGGVFLVASSAILAMDWLEWTW